MRYLVSWLVASLFCSLPCCCYLDHPDLYIDAPDAGMTIMPGVNPRFYASASVRARIPSISCSSLTFNFLAQPAEAALLISLWVNSPLIWLVAKAHHDNSYNHCRPSAARFWDPNCLFYYFAVLNPRSDWAVNGADGAGLAGDGDSGCGADWGAVDVLVTDTLPACDSDCAGEVSLTACSLTLAWFSVFSETTASFAIAVETLLVPVAPVSVDLRCYAWANITIAKEEQRSGYLISALCNLLIQLI